MDKSTVVFAFFLGIVVGLFLGVYTLAKTALWERRRAVAQADRDGYVRACVDHGIAPLELLRRERQQGG